MNDNKPSFRQNFKDKQQQASQDIADLFRNRWVAAVVVVLGIALIGWTILGNLR